MRIRFALVQEPRNDRRRTGIYRPAKTVLPVQGSLFSHDFLTASITGFQDWTDLDDASVSAIHQQLETIFAGFPTGQPPNESQTEGDLIWPVLACLGWDARSGSKTFRHTAARTFPTASCLLTTRRRAARTSRPRNGGATNSARRWSNRSAGFAPSTATPLDEAKKPRRRPRCPVIPNSLQNPKILVGVESRRGAVAWALWASLRFLSPLIKPDVRISRIRLPDRLHLKAHGGGPRWTRRSRITPSSPNTTLSGKRLVPRDDTLWRLTRK